MLFKGFFSWLLILILILTAQVPVTKASVMGGEELLLNILLSQKNLAQFKMNTFVNVYDPEAETPLSEPLAEESINHELPDQAFTQEIIWVRDEFLGVETRSTQQDPRHIYIRAENREFSKNLSDEKLFTTEDVVPCMVSLFTKHKPVFVNRLNLMGIETNTVEYITRDNKVYYMLGTEKSYLLIEPEKYRIVEVHREINIDGRDYEISIKFKEWNKKYINLPMMFEYYIKDRLFKTVNVDKIQLYGVGGHRNRMLKKYKSMLHNYTNYPAEINYAQ